MGQGVRRAEEGRLAAPIHWVWPRENVLTFLFTPIAPYPSARPRRALRRGSNDVM
jgi:hypothetical protein